MVGPKQEAEQRLREAARDRRSLHLGGDEPPDGEEISTLVRLFGQFQETVRKGLRVTLRASIWPVYRGQIDPFGPFWVPCGPAFRVPPGLFGQFLKRIRLIGVL